MIGGLALLSLQLVEVGGAAGETPAAPPAARPAVPPVREEELLLFAVTLDNGTLTEALTAYGNPDDPLLPLGELSRLLDLNVSVSPAEGRATGRLGESERSLTIDLGLGLGRVGGNDVALKPEEVALSATDIFIRASAMERVLPLKIKVQSEALLIQLEATEKLPIQAQRERAGRIAGLGRDVSSADPVLTIATPYRLFTPPAADIALESGNDSRTGLFTRRYDLRLAGDIFHTGFKGYVGSDERGDPSSARIEFQRRSPEGGLLGPLDATYVAGGDVFTPALAIGARSAGGRGFSFTTAQLERTNVFQRITIRGELPIGYDVELYVNDVLRSGQRAPVEGRYEFIDVPLARGINVLRVVTYGPRGERAEETRIINVGGGQLASGETSFDFGVVEQERPVLQLADADEVPVTPGYGKLRIAANVAHGLSEELTVVAGAALYPGGEGERRELLTVGARGSLFGMAVQGDVARDLQGGTAGAIGLAGQPLGVSLVARHAEYRGGFVDETSRLFNVNRPVRRYSELTLDMTLPPIGGKIIPLSFRLEREGFVDGGARWTALGRASTTLANTLVSAGFDYNRQADPGAAATHRLTGNVSLSRFIDYKWQVRGVIDYDILPETALRSLFLTADRNLSEKLGVRFGLGRSFGEGGDLTAQAGAFLRLPFADLAFTGDYAVKGDWRFGVRLAFGLAFDPGVGNYRMTRPGPASGGSISFHSFIDANGNGAYDGGEEPVSGVALEGIERKVATGADGRAFTTGLGDNPAATLKANIENIDAFYVSSPPQNIEFSPRAGKVVEIAYPLVPSAEIYAQVNVSRGGRSGGLAAVRVRLVRDGVEPIEGTTEFDGSVIFGGVRPGTYRLELDPDQAERLGMRLKEPVSVTVQPDGSAPDIRTEVVFANAAD